MTEEAEILAAVVLVAIGKYKSVKAEAWFVAALYLEDMVDENPSLQEHILKAIVPALKRRAEIIERKHRSNKTA
jgi:CRP-like cAMP-binding protein